MNNCLPVEQHGARIAAQHVEENQGTTESTLLFNTQVVATTTTEQLNENGMATIFYTTTKLHAINVAEHAQSTVPRATVESSGGYEPYFLKDCNAPKNFNTLPTSRHFDPFVTGYLNTNTSPSGSTLNSLTYNIRHAIENNDKSHTTLCLVEMFRHFIYLNRPMKRFTPSHLQERRVLLNMSLKLGPFENPASYGMYLRIRTLIFSIAFRQIGIAAPTIMSYIRLAWDEFDKMLFTGPILSLARLIQMGVTLCNSHKDGSVAYIRDIFDNTATMIKRRKEILINRDLLQSYFESSQQQNDAYTMLGESDAFYNLTDKTRTPSHYQDLCVEYPHPELMVRGGLMDSMHVTFLFQKITQDIPPKYHSNPFYLNVLEIAKNTMLIMSYQCNNMFSREAYKELQIECQIFLYLLQKMLIDDQTTGKLFTDSQATIMSAPTNITMEYALRIWTVFPDMSDVMFYGIERRHTTKKRIHLDADRHTPDLITSSTMKTPPSISLDNEGVITLKLVHQINQIPTTRPFRFLFRLYRITHMWKHIVSSNKQHMKEVQLECRINYAEFADMKKPHRVLYSVPDSLMAAMEVHLHPHAALGVLEMMQAHRRGDNHAARIEVSNADDLQTFADKIDIRVQKDVKAILIGPFHLQDFTRLEAELAEHDGLKHSLTVQPDIVFAKKMTYATELSLATNSLVTGEQLVENYAWAVYIPSMNTEHNHFVMTIHELQILALNDKVFCNIAEVILRPILNLIAVMEETCGESSNYSIDDNYVSFSVQINESDVIVQNPRIHMVTETLLQDVPEYHTAIPPQLTTTQVIKAYLDKLCLERELEYDNAVSELRKLRMLMIERKGMHERVDAQTDPPWPADHERLTLEAMTVIQTINGISSRDFEAFSESIDSLRGIFNQLKPSTDPEFLFQQDNQTGGVIFWGGMYRKWFYLLQKNPKTKDSTEQYRQYLNILNPDKGSDFVKRKIRVAMHTSLREKVISKKMTLKNAMSEITQ